MADLDRARQPAVDDVIDVHANPIGENPLFFIHRKLRGRYTMAIALGLLLAIPFALVGYRSSKPQYTSVGLVEITPTKTVIMYQTPENTVPPMFDSFVQTQATYLQTARVVENAVDSAELQAAGWPRRPRGVTELQRRLSVRAPRNAQVIQVSVSHESPKLAKAAVDAVINAYMETYGGNVLESSELRDILFRRQQVQQSNINNLNQDILALGSHDRQQYERMLSRKNEEIERLNAEIQGLTDGIEDARARAEAAGPASIEGLSAEELAMLDEEIANIDDEMQTLLAERDRLESASAADPAPSTDDSESAERRRRLAVTNEQIDLKRREYITYLSLTPEQIAREDPAMNSLLIERNRIEADIRTLRQTLGEHHREVKELVRVAAAMRERIKLRRHEVIGLLVAGAAVKVVEGAPLAASLSLEQMQSLKAQKEARKAQLNADVDKLSRDKRVLERLEEDLNKQKSMLEETIRRIDEVTIESADSDAARVAPRGEASLPVNPSSDKRMPMAVLGAGFGAGLGVGLVFLLSLSDRGFRFIDEVERIGAATSAPLLGTLPDLSDGDAAHEELAALSVHHLRNMLQHQLGGADSRSKVYTITSASAGDGKTSLSLALGMSFAVAGQRTLLLDSDLVGRGLSRELQMNDLPGFCQAVVADSVNGEIHATPDTPNLWVMPAGLSESFEAKHLSHSAVKALLDRLRDRFDTVLIDTGPLMGSLEANLVASLCDRVVLTVSRGQDAKLVDAALVRLSNMGAPCAGVVFNKARTQDFDRSYSYASFNSQSIRPPIDESSDQASAPRSGLLKRALGGATDSAAKLPEEARRDA